MTNLEGDPKNIALEERLIRRYMYRIEKGDDVVVSRIHSTLSIDSTTKPSALEVKEYVKILIGEKRNVQRND